MTNIFRQAAEFLKAKDAGAKLTKKEHRLIDSTVAFVVNTDGLFDDDITIGEGLEELAKIVEEEEVGRAADG